MPKSKKIDRKSKSKDWYEAGSDNIFKDLGHNEPDAANLLLRSDMMMEIANIIDERGWSQAEAAKVLGVKQPRVSELTTGRISKFKIDILVKYLNLLGKKVTLQLEDAAKNKAA